MVLLTQTSLNLIEVGKICFERRQLLWCRRDLRRPSLLLESKGKPALVRRRRPPDKGFDVEVCFPRQPLPPTHELQVLAGVEEEVSSDCLRGRVERGASRVDRFDEDVSQCSTVEVGGVSRAYEREEARRTGRDVEHAASLA